MTGLGASLPAFIAASLACLGANASRAAAPWAEDLWLGRGDWWRNRIAISVTNTTDSAWTGRVVAARIDGLRNLPERELRLVASDGAELEYDVRGDILAVPVTCDRGAEATLYLYYGNPSAWELAERLKGEVDAALPVAVGGRPETLSVREPPAERDWLRAEDGRPWAYRLLIRLLNSGDACRGPLLVTIPEYEVRRETGSAEYRIAIGGRVLTPYVLGGSVVFELENLPARTVLSGFCYVRKGRPAEAEDHPEATLMSEVPNDVAFAGRDALSPEAKRFFRRLQESDFNLVHNPSFERINPGNARHPAQVWNPSGDLSGCAPEVAEGRAAFGTRFAQLRIPPGLPRGWRGWTQRIGVVSGRTYLFGCAVAGEGVSADLGMDLHVRDARNGILAYLGTRKVSVRDEGWRIVTGTALSSPAMDHFDVRLTTSGHGVVKFDGVLVAEAHPAMVGEREWRPDLHSERDFAAEPVPTTVKVFRDRPVRDRSGGMTLSLARNEAESIQVAYRSKTALPALDVSATALRGADGSELQAELFKVVEVPVDYPSAFHHVYVPEWGLKRPVQPPTSDGWSGWWPDPMYPAERESLPANRTQALRLQVRAGKDARPGLYRGEIVWKADGREFRRDAVTVKVWDFAIPERPEFAAIYDLWHNPSFWAPRGWKDRRAFNEFCWKHYAEYCISPDKPFHYVSITCNREGRWREDFRLFDREADLFFGTYRFPVAYMPAQYYLFGWGHRPAKFLGEEPYDGTDRGRLRKPYRKVYQGSLSRFWSHMKEKGWADRFVLYLADEPYLDEPGTIRQMSALCDMIHEVDPRIRIYSSTWRHQPAWDGKLDIWGVGNYGCFPVGTMSRLKAAGKGIWFTTDGQTVIDTPYAYTERALAWYSFVYGASAYEFWSATCHTHDPWKFGWPAYGIHSGRPGEGFYQRLPSGDGYLFYPERDGGKTTRLYPSIRLEAARDGVEDHAYFTALARLAEGNSSVGREAKSILEDLRKACRIPNSGGRCTSSELDDPAFPDRLRSRAGELLSGRDR